MINYQRIMLTAYKIRLIYLFDNNIKYILSYLAEMKRNTNWFTLYTVYNTVKEDIRTVNVWNLGSKYFTPYL